MVASNFVGIWQITRRQGLHRVVKSNAICPPNLIAGTVCSVIEIWGHVAKDNIIYDNART